MKYDIVKPQDSKILHEKCEVFDFDNPQIDPIELYQLLVDNLVKYKGIGLSACQIGIPLRVFIMGHHSQPKEMLPVFNPIIVNYSKEQFTIEEGCLSYPGLFVKVVKEIKIPSPKIDKNSNQYFVSIAVRVSNRENLIAFT